MSTEPNAIDRMPTVFASLENAAPDEAAAIAATLELHLRDQRQPTDEFVPGPTDHMDDSRWRFAGRLERTATSRGTVSSYAPRNGWRAASRADRF